MGIKEKQITLTPKSMTRPYTETEHTQHGTERKYLIRTFSEEVEGRELVWHRDKTTRQVHVLLGTDWELQKDDELPVKLEIGKDYFILKNQYHRLLKGKGDLVIRIDNVYTPTKEKTA